MDYCIYRTINNGKPLAIRTFTQKETGSRAKRTANEELHDLFVRVAVRPLKYRNLKAYSNTDFAYDGELYEGRFVRFRFYIAPKVKD